MPEISLLNTTISALPHQRSQTELSWETFREEPAITVFDGLFTPNPKSREWFETQYRYQTSTRLSLGFILFRIRSNSFWSHSCDYSHFHRKLLAWTASFSLSLRLLLLRLVSPQPWTPRPVFRNGLDDAVISALYTSLARFSFCREPFTPSKTMTKWFQDLFTFCEKYFSAFCRHTNLLSDSKDI